MVVRWTFEDPQAATPTVYEFEMNPDAGGTPQYAKNTTYMVTAAPDGNAIIFEGRDTIREISISGTILTQTHLNSLKEWYDKRHQIYMTDDLSRQFTVYILSFETERERSALYPWKHSYTMRLAILDWPS